MNLTQREAALRLADNMDLPLEAWMDQAATMLRELAAEPEPDHFVNPMVEQLTRVIAGIWHEHPDYSLRQTLEALNALMLPAEPVPVAEPHYTITWDAQGRRLVNGDLAPEHRMTEPVQEPVAWLHREPYLLAHAKNSAPADRMLADGWTPLYAAPQQRKPLVDEIVRPLIDDTSEVFDANGPETPQVVRDVIEYVQSWLEVYFDKRGETP